MLKVLEVLDVTYSIHKVLKSALGYPITLKR